jgi:hypothetical protein
MTDTRADFTAALRQLADWFDANPQCPTGGNERFLLPLLTNDAVTELAQQNGLEIVAKEGNLSADIKFGPITLHAYGYADFAQHHAASKERNAREWADQNNLELVPRADA